MRWLETIIDSIFPLRESELCVRSVTENAILALHSPTIVETVSGCVSLLPYQHPIVQACILEAKFHGNARAAALLGIVLREYLIGLLENDSYTGAAKHILIPLPLSRARIRSRGYNQTERIAQAACAGLEDFVHIHTDILLRTRDTPPQTSLSGQARRHNIQGAFSVASPLDSRHTYILIDDVVTTGSTLTESTETLERAGARDVQAIAIAH